MARRRRKKREEKGEKEKEKAPAKTTKRKAAETKAKEPPKKKTKPAEEPPPEPDTSKDAEIAAQLADTREGTRNRDATGSKSKKASALAKLREASTLCTRRAQDWKELTPIILQFRSEKASRTLKRTTQTKVMGLTLVTTTTMTLMMTTRTARQ